MNETDSLLLGSCVILLAAAVIVLAARVAALADDIDLMTTTAGHPATLLDAKRMIERRRAERAEGEHHD